MVDYWNAPVLRHLFMGDTAIAWEHGSPGGKKEPEQPENKLTVKTGNGDCLVGASRYRMGQMRTNGDILGHLSKGG